VIGTLTDSGPIYALIDRDDAYHGAAIRGLEHIVLPLLTTWPCLTEAMHFLGKRIGPPGRRALAEMLRRGDLIVLDSDRHSVGAVTELMERYADAPMDLADASLVAAAMGLDMLDVLTFDAHFGAYRGLRNRRFRVFPGPA
jgi:predicted nucleic acid-binding protein